MARATLGCCAHCRWLSWARHAAPFQYYCPPLPNLCGLLVHLNAVITHPETHPALSWTSGVHSLPDEIQRNFSRMRDLDSRSQSECPFLPLQPPTCQVLRVSLRPVFPGLMTNVEKNSRNMLKSIKFRQVNFDDPKQVSMAVLHPIR
jgi:hypothetical protein